VDRPQGPAVGPGRHPRRRLPRAPRRRRVAGADARDQLARRADALEEQLNGPLADADFVGKSAAAQRVIAFVTRVGPSDATVLLGGESGSGKEMVARAIHRASRRAKGPCVAVNCAALTESLIESELFATRRARSPAPPRRSPAGSRWPTAARCSSTRRRAAARPADQVPARPRGPPVRTGRRPEADRGRRPGRRRQQPRPRRDVKRARSGGSVLPAQRHPHRGPPLRDRRDDVPLLAELFLARFRGQPRAGNSGFAPDALAAMTHYAWPGNVRELRKRGRARHRARRPRPDRRRRSAAPRSSPPRPRRHGFRTSPAHPTARLSQPRAVVVSSRSPPPRSPRRAPHRSPPRFATAARRRSPAAAKRNPELRSTAGDRASGAQANSPLAPCPRRRHRLPVRSSPHGRQAGAAERLLGS